MHNESTFNTITATCNSQAVMYHCHLYSLWEYLQWWQNYELVNWGMGWEVPARALRSGQRIRILFRKSKGHSITVVKPCPRRRAQYSYKCVGHSLAWVIYVRVGLWLSAMNSNNANLTEVKCRKCWNRCFIFLLLP